VPPTGSRPAVVLPFLRTPLAAAARRHVSGATAAPVGGLPVERRSWYGRLADRRGTGPDGEEVT
jgi:hypothetical protein